MTKIAKRRRVSPPRQHEKSAAQRLEYTEYVKRALADSTVEEQEVTEGTELKSDSRNDRFGKAFVAAPKPAPQPKSRNWPGPNVWLGALITLVCGLLLSLVAVMVANARTLGQKESDLANLKAQMADVKGTASISVRNDEAIKNLTDMTNQRDSALSARIVRLETKDKSSE
jgi:hypothetical protein